MMLAQMSDQCSTIQVRGAADIALGMTTNPCV
jgi:hypothetical protein